MSICQVLTKEDEDKILKEIGYSRAQLQRDIPALKLWLHEQTHLPPCRLTECDTFLSNYLVGCKGSIESAKKKLDCYYTLRGKGDLFSNRENFDYVDRVSSYCGIVDLPKPTPEGNFITFARLVDSNVDVYEGAETLKQALLTFEHRLRSSPIHNQQLYILDAQSYQMAHFLKLPPQAIRTFLTFFQDAYPIRVKQIVIGGVHPVLATAINTVVVPFLSKKLKTRFTVSSDPIEKIFDHVDLLPSDVEGGKQKPLKELCAAWSKELKTSLKDIVPQLQEEVDESKRPQLQNGINDAYFGLHGSIKTLVLD